MHARRALRGLLAAAALSTLGSALAGTPAGCELPDAERSPLADRAGTLAQYERLPQACLQQIFRACSEASGRGFLDFASAATCSFGYEALLRQQFHGSFPDLLAWWRAQQGETLQ
jgi:hypothetical protein